ncbi:MULTISPECIES: helix-turn-helix transcriptional regulator [unclassified Nocardia]|uniref:helix-turn-helix domain-containing protein n=1 Tax=unclassified Nocardia TaxID=2637762 RepID=UPI001CE47542|nr:MULTISPECIES: helix-turn-helix transcriptional regulator [unclassified Nocardia]
MANERLRGAMAAANFSKNGLAEAVDVGMKTVERWLTQDRCPHPGMRLKVARVLGCEETYLWPELLSGTRSAAASLSEIVQIWPTRSEVPHDVWRSLMRQATKQLEILVYAGGFLVESLDFVNVVRAKSNEGAEIRILLGDSDSENVRARSREEGLPSLPQRCHSTLEYLWETAHLPRVDIRTHHTPLYNSIYRFDDSMLVNTHSYGAYAAKSPVQHLQQVPGGHLFSYYRDSFEAVWATARPAVL